MGTETGPIETKMTNLRGRLDAIAPYPECTPFPVQMLIKHMAADLQVIHSRFVRRVQAGEYRNDDLIDGMRGLFAACYALRALHEADPAMADVVGHGIYEAGETGDYGEIGAGWLRGDYPAVLVIAGQIAAALAESDLEQSPAAILASLPLKWRKESAEVWNGMAPCVGIEQVRAAQGITLIACAEDLEGALKAGAER